jgi:secondary thiamine-phosphate synthase enzyme
VGNTLNVRLEEIRIDTAHQRELVDITGEVLKCVEQSEIKNGICVVFSMHSTSAIIINENEAGLKEDILKKVFDDFHDGSGWQHDRIDDNAAAHLASAFTGSSVVIPVKSRSLTLGMWQSVFFLELDGPRSSRRVVVEVMGE